MKLMGVFANSGAILIGSIIGAFIGGKLPANYSKTILKGTALVITTIGIKGTFEMDNVLLMISSIVIGALIGEFLKLDDRLINLGEMLERKFSKGEGKKSLSRGFVSGSLLFAVGAMAIMGSLESGLTNNHDMLYAKAVIDGISSIVMASSLGIGVALSSLSVLFYQGIIVLGSGLLSGVLSPSVIADITGVGSLLIIAIGLNVLGISEIKVANLLPAVFIPIIFSLIL